jgi:hypothetical protein
VARRAAVLRAVRPRAARPPGHRRIPRQRDRTLGHRDDAREAGLDDKTARAEARLVVAVTRGLLLDLLATGDRDGVTEAFERFLYYALAARQSGQPAPPA